MMRNKLLCIGLALAISSPAAAGWGSFGGGSFGSGGSRGSSYGSVWGSYGSGGSSSGSFGSFHRTNRLLGHGSSGGSSGGSYGSVFGGSHGSSAGSSGSLVGLAAHGSNGGSSGGSLGSSYGSSGGLFHGGLINRLRSLHQTKMSWLRSHGHGSSGGSSGASHGSSGGASATPSHYGSTGSSSHGSTGGYSYSAPLASSFVSASEPSLATPTVAESLASSTAVYGDSSNLQQPTIAEPSLSAKPTTENADGTLHVAVPEAAKLFVNGQLTTSTGTTRQFVSKGLKPGYRYPYTVKAVVEVGGREVEQSKTVELRAGESLDLAFQFQDATTTKLTLRVPASAEVELAGIKTKARGSERTFSTNKLASGTVWDDYQVVVTFDGVTKQQTISLRGGDTRTLVFDFDVNEVASR